MRLSRLYTNFPAKFEPIEFEDGLNVVIAEIRLPENQDRDTHNLGKTTLGKIIDFCLLMKKSKKFFLFEYPEHFEDFVFYVELKLIDDSYLTLRRSVRDATLISFKRHVMSVDFLENDVDDWDHEDVTFDRAKQMLDSMLDLQVAKPWDFRRGLGYLIRGQDDYTDIFKLASFAGAHSQWKPFLAHMLGFNSANVTCFYDQEKALSEETLKLKTIELELAGLEGNASKVEGLLQLKRKESEERAKLLDRFDFKNADLRKTESLVDEIDSQIAELNKRRYSLKHSKKKISDTLERDQIVFDPEKATELFREANVFFEGQIKKDFEQLIEFNRSITSERLKYLREELKEIKLELTNINNRLEELSSKRSGSLAFLSSTDVFRKFKQLSEDQTRMLSDIATLERQKEFLARMQVLRNSIRTIGDEKDRFRDEIQIDVEAKNTDEESVFSRIRFYFNDIVNEVIDRHALLSVQLNGEDHLEFAGEILNETGHTTSASSGNSYKKLLCIAFDLAVLRARLDQRFSRFAFHDGVFETLDPRKKSKLLKVIRHYTELGLQLIVTTLDSDLPPSDNDESVFSETEVVLRLHDEGIEGRLFKVPTW